MVIFGGVQGYHVLLLMFVVIFWDGHLDSSSDASPRAGLCRGRIT
jgi:hypothetical protein